ncbi:MAG TPA: glucose-1-phosphate thymidylyltransferase RfbA [Acidobacteriota bacterium]|nr:glucose-1-phosphate thymidylyltransferase RfbA [Acidobacteriota bacterium]
MRGIILAGGRGTRLFPLTMGASKQLLPVYDKPMVYYPLATLMLAGIRDMLIISTPEALPAYRALLGDGKQWGLSFSFAEQAEPRGLADAFLVGREFLSETAKAPRTGTVCLILGDNIFFGHGLPDQLRRAAETVEREGGAMVFAYPVRDPERYGVIELDASGRALGIEEKPARARSNYAVPGIYFYDGRVVERASVLQPSARGELEITELNNIYLELRELRVEILGRGFAWLDAGTPEALLQAANFVQAVEERQGMMISSPEEIAFRLGYIGVDELRALAKTVSSQYGQYLTRLADGKI